MGRAPAAPQDDARTGADRYVASRLDKRCAGKNCSLSVHLFGSLLAAHSQGLPYVCSVWHENRLTDGSPTLMTLVLARRGCVGRFVTVNYILPGLVQIRSGSNYFCRAPVNYPIFERS